MKKGRAGTMTHDYKRHGTTTLFAALNVLDGTVIAVERLDLALLIYREDDGVGAGAGANGDPRRRRQLRDPRSFSTNSGSFDSLNVRIGRNMQTQAHSGRLGKFPARPVGALARRRPQGQIDHPLNGVGRQRGLTRLARLVAQQPFDALRHARSTPPASIYRTGA
jgi:hypothetical protein